MKIILLVLKWTLLPLLGLISLYFVASWLLARIPTGGETSDQPAKNRLYLDSNGVHCDFVIPMALVPEELLRQLQRQASTAFLGFGWGDKGFYLDTPTWAELKASVAVKAMLLPSPTAMHVTQHDRVGEDWRYVDITDEQLSILWNHIRSGFRLDENGAIEEIAGKGYTKRDHFYEGTSSYSAVFTCNTWVNRGLKKLGVKTGLWTSTDAGIMRYVTPVNPEVTEFS